MSSSRLLAGRLKKVHKMFVDESRMLRAAPDIDAPKPRISDGPNIWLMSEDEFIEILSKCSEEYEKNNCNRL